jgi:hypothetical protein
VTSALFQSLRMAAVPLLVITDLFLFLINFSEHLTLLFMIIYIISSTNSFRKFNSISTNMVPYLNFIILSVNTQGQTYSAYFDLSNAFDIVPHNIWFTQIIGGVL